MDNNDDDDDDGEDLNIAGNQSETNEDFVVAKRHTRRKISNDDDWKLVGWQRSKRSKRTKIIKKPRVFGRFRNGNPQWVCFDTRKEAEQYYGLSPQKVSMILRNEYESPLYELRLENLPTHK